MTVQCDNARFCAFFIKKLMLFHSEIDYLVIYLGNTQPISSISSSIYRNHGILFSIHCSFIFFCGMLILCANFEILKLILQSLGRDMPTTSWRSWRRFTVVKCATKKYLLLSGRPKKKSHQLASHATTPQHCFQQYHLTIAKFVGICTYN
jgi:hypothetical protein